MTATRLHEPAPAVPLWDTSPEETPCVEAPAVNGHRRTLPPNGSGRIRLSPPLAPTTGEPGGVVKAATVREVLVPGIGFVVGTALVCVAYAWAATRPPGNLEFALFWLGELIAVVPVAVRLSGADTSRPQRLALVAATGLFSFVPKFLRDPSAPLFHDELAHWHEAQAVFHAGHPFVPSTLIPIIADFPGLATLTAGLQHLTGLSTFRVATVLVWILHVLALVGVFVLVERLTGSSRAAGIAALVYAVSPAFLFFDAQFAYESLAIVFFIWILACVAALGEPGATPRQRSTWFVVAIILAAACVVTHHVTTYALVLALLLVSVAAGLRHRADRRADRRADGEARQVAHLTWALTAAVAAGAVAWLVIVAPGTMKYLAPHLQQGLSDLVGLVRQRSGARTLFRASPVPGYERVAAFLTPVILAGLCAGALWTMRRQRHRLAPALLGLAAFGSLYFFSLPVMLTAQSEGARRSWTFTYVGLAVVIGAFAVEAARRFDRSPRERRIFAGAVAAVAAILLVGNVSVQTTVAYRFPGPYVYGSDTRSLTPELLAAARWLRDAVRPDQRVVTPIDNGLAFGSYGDQLLAAPSRALPTWELYFSTAQPSPALLSELRGAGYAYLVTDSRMAQDLPEVGYYVAPDEPSANAHTHPPPAAALTKFDALPWVTRIYSSDHLRIYRFDFTDVGACPWGARLPAVVIPCLVAHR